MLALSLNEWFAASNITPAKIHRIPRKATQSTKASEERNNPRLRNKSMNCTRYPISLKMFLSRCTMQRISIETKRM